MSQRKRYALVGTGGRSGMYIEATTRTHQDYAQLVGLCDISQTRMDYWNRQFDHPAVPTFLAKDFDRMIVQTRPDVVIITSMDCTHHLYIIRAVQLGCDVICEKPLTVDAEKAQAVVDAVEKSGRKVTVTFNCRYAPTATLVRDVVMSGKIGQPLAVDLMWTLDTSHGADYFRRWHREKDKSGGLLVHKATHHFDLVNFWIDSFPKTVFAMGELKFYGRANAEARGEHYSYDRYTDVPEAKDDPFALRLNGKWLKGLYRDAEEDSGYIRDRNVFGDKITAEDTMAVIAKYRNGVQLSYSLVAYSPWEGRRACITGTKGRVELLEMHDSHIIVGQTDVERAAEQKDAAPAVPGSGISVVYYPMFGKSERLEVPEVVGGHGGSDPLILDQLFLPNPPADPYHRQADHIDGAASILLGIAANQSIATGKAMEVDELVKLPERKYIEPVAEYSTR